VVEKPKFHDLAVKAKDGDGEALVQLLCSLNPAIKRYSRWPSQPRHWLDCYSDLVIWLLKTIRRYPG
jgi:hypothetical protein